MELLKITVQAASAAKNARGASVQFAKNIEQTDKGPAAREVIVFNIADSKFADLISVADAKGVGKNYEITVTEV